MHAAPRYSISKSHEQETLNFYNCGVRFCGYHATASTRWKKHSKQKAAKALLKQIASDAKRKGRKGSNRAEERTDAKIPGQKRAAESQQVKIHFKAFSV